MLTIREHRFFFLEKVGDWNRFNRNTGGTLVEKCCHFFDLTRLIAGCNPVRMMASGGQSVNHLEEVHDGQTSDIWDNAFVVVDFENGLRTMLELCMFAEGLRYQEEIRAVGPKGKIECLIPGAGRFWPAHLGPAPTPQVVVSPRHPAGPPPSGSSRRASSIRCGRPETTSGISHNRRDFILDGATRGVFSDLRLPVLLSH